MTTENIVDTIKDSFSKIPDYAPYVALLGTPLENDDLQSILGYQDDDIMVNYFQDQLYHFFFT